MTATCPRGEGDVRASRLASGAPRPWGMDHGNDDARAASRDLADVGRLLVRASGSEIDRNNSNIAVTPLSVDKINTFSCCQVERGIGPSVRRVGIRFRECATSQKDQRDEGDRSCDS